VAVGGDKQVAVASKQGSRTVLRAANRSHPMMAGSRAQGRRSVAVWLTSSAVSIHIATDRLRSSPLVQLLPIRQTVLTFLHFVVVSLSVTTWRATLFTTTENGNMAVLVTVLWGFPTILCC